MSFIDPNTLSAAANSPYALAILSLLSFSESSFFIIPPEVLLIPLAIASPSSAIMLGLITSITSIFGALFGYWIGQKGGKPILRKLFDEEKVETVKILFHKYDAWAILVAAFTPIPFKISTISAGAFDIDLKRFTVASAIGRGTRYMLISVLLFFYGEPIKYFIEHQLGIVLLLGTLGIIALVFLKKFFIPFIEKRYLQESLLDKFQRFFSKKR